MSRLKKNDLITPKKVKELLREYEEKGSQLNEELLKLETTYQQLNATKSELMKELKTDDIAEINEKISKAKKSIETLENTIFMYEQDNKEYLNHVLNKFSITAEIMTSRNEVIKQFLPIWKKYIDNHNKVVMKLEQEFKSAYVSSMKSYAEYMKTLTKYKNKHAHVQAVYDRNRKYNNREYFLTKPLDENHIPVQLNSPFTYQLEQKMNFKLSLAKAKHDRERETKVKARTHAEENKLNFDDKGEWRIGRRYDKYFLPKEDVEKIRQEVIKKEQAELKSIESRFKGKFK